MNHKRRYSASNQYRGLEEALNTVLEDSDDGLEYDLAIIPPEPSVVTDEEEGFDDETIANNLPGDVPGEIEVFVQNIGTLSDSEDDSDNEPLAAKRTRKNNTQRSNESSDAQNRSALNVPTWRKCTPNYSKIYAESDDRLCNENRMKEEVKDLTPVQIFQKFFDDELFTMIVDFIQQYASQNNIHNFSVTIAELKVFFGILLLSGYHKLPRESMYWSLDEDIGD
ncbi:hypothetical protein HF086_005370 [Spodoptera exigua]|uniref:PiggyBac transposable element-derived protein domain-containing protein n=1 Tax=Spodoptera exigua TaxID=7107 RepID=A0A922M888_SPOEX|nr:hypothetical protein HF086_005370 [Spodoptera exigua]